VNHIGYSFVSQDPKGRENMSSLQEWISAALLVADFEDMTDDEVIPTWPEDCVEQFPNMFPQLTVGALREWQAVSAQAIAVVPSGVWQFYFDGEWTTGMNTNDHRANTKAAGFLIRDLWLKQEPTQ
jgi:hypothetical protein